MPTKGIPTNAAAKKAPNGRPANTQGQCTISCKQEVYDDSESSSDEGTKRPQKRWRWKGKGKKSVPEPVESVEESNSKESDGLELIDVDAMGPENGAERQNDLVCRYK
jgi:hypothetical protein